MGVIRRRTIVDGQERWSDVELRAYSGEDGPRGTKQILLGPADGAANFALRIFQLAPGKTSNEEKHPHDHGVMIMQGRARVLLGSERFEVEPGDVVWVEPNEHHCFESLGPDALRFLCVVPTWGEVDGASCVMPAQDEKKS